MKTRERRERGSGVCAELKAKLECRLCLTVPCQICTFKGGWLDSFGHPILFWEEACAAARAFFKDLLGDSLLPDFWRMIRLYMGCDGQAGSFQGRTSSWWCNRSHLMYRGDADCLFLLDEQIIKYANGNTAAPLRTESVCVCSVNDLFWFDSDSSDPPSSMWQAESWTTGSCKNTSTRLLSACSQWCLSVCAGVCLAQ